MDNQIINPFPQAGTPGSIAIEPIGYDEKLEEIRELVSNNVGHQPLIINVCGEYGQGKTTVLKYLETKFNGEWENLEVKIEDISDFPNFSNLITTLNDKAEQNKKNGIFLILDEMQHVIVEEERKGLTENQKTFLSLLRSFADNNMEVDVSNVVLCLAMHPQTKLFFDKNGYSDVEQRTNNFFLNLKDLDYLSAYLIVDSFFRKINKNFNDFFDESFINAFFILLQDLEKKRRDLKTLNGRSYIQIFFNLFEYWRKKSIKLTQNDLKNILLGKEELMYHNVKIELANAEEFNNTSELISLNNTEAWERFVFNPKWHLHKELIQTENIGEKILSDLTEKGFISKRKALIISLNQDKDFRYKFNEKLKYLKSEKIYLEGEKKAYFVDELDKETLEKIDHKISLLYRLKDDYLKIFYGYGPKESLTDELINYYNLDPSEKVNSFFQNIDDQISRQYFDEIKKKSREVGTKYDYLTTKYNPVPKIEHNIGIFFYSEGYGGKFSHYLNEIINEIENSDFELGIIFLCPYFSSESPSESYNIRDMENRLFIEDLDKDEFIQILRGEFNSIEEAVSNSTRIFMKEAVEKGLTMPLTGFQEKIGNSQKEFRNLLIGDITHAWELEIKKRSGEKINTLESPSILEDGVDGTGKSKLTNLAISSLSEFIDLDENLLIKGSKFSKFEHNYWNLFGSEEVYKDEISKTKAQIFAKYSRFDIEQIVVNILKNKFLLKETDDKYIKIKPTDYVSLILNSFTDINLEDLSKSPDLPFKETISKFKHILTEMKWDTLENRSFYNYQLNLILNKITGYENEENNISESIAEEYSGIMNDLNTAFFDVKLENIDLSIYLKNLDMPKIELNSKYVNIEKINDYVSQIIANFTFDYDKDLIADLRSISDKLNNITLDKNSVFEFNSILDEIEAGSQITGSQSIAEKVLMGEFDNLSQSEYGIIYNFLVDLHQKVIKPAIKRLDLISNKFQNIIKLNEKLNEYKPAIENLADINRDDIFLNSLKTIHSIISLNKDYEFSYIQNLLITQLDLIEPYLGFLEQNSGKNELELIKKVEREVKLKTSKNLADYLSYIKKLNGIEFLEYKLILEFGKNNIEDKELITKIDSVKRKEEQLRERTKKEILDYILHEGFLKRLTVREEYYKNGKKIKNEQVSYSIRENKL